MVKARNMVDYRIPYIMLVSKFMEHFGVDLDGKLVETIKPHEVTAATLHNGDHQACRAKEEGKGQHKEEGESSNVSATGQNAHSVCTFNGQS